MKTPRVPEPTKVTYARQLADEAKTLVPGMERLAVIAAELRADDLYRVLGFDTWEAFCTGYFGVSKWTANRWMAGPKPKSIGAGQRVAAVQNAPVVESNTLKVAAASTEAPKTSEGAGSSQRAPSGPSRSEGVVKDTTVTASASSDVAPTPSDTARNATERPPSVRALTSRVLAPMHDVEPADAGPVLTPEEATFLRQWTQRTLDAFRAVHAPKPTPKQPRKQPLVIPSPRQPTTNGSLHRPQVTPMFKGK